jgi:hypothetical protein
MSLARRRTVSRLTARAPQNLVKGGPTIEWIGRDTPLGRTETAPETPYERRQLT